MKYVLTDSGDIKIKDGKPLVVDDSGKEFTIDAIANHSTIADLHKESAGHRKEAAKYKKIVDELGDIDIAKAKEALATVDNLSDQHKLDIENLKSSLNTTWQEKLDAAVNEAADLKAKLFDATVTSKFATSEVLKQTVLTPDIAATFFGKNFQQDGTAVDKSGNIIYSREKPGEPADFDEALQILIDTYPLKNAIMRGSGTNGSGSHNTNGGGTGLSQEKYYRKDSPEYSLTEQAKIAKDNPELHKQLKAATS